MVFLDLVCHFATILSVEQSVVFDNRHDLCRIGRARYVGDRIKSILDEMPQDVLLETLEVIVSTKLGFNSKDAIHSTLCLTGYGCRPVLVRSDRQRRRLFELGPIRLGFSPGPGCPSVGSDFSDVAKLGLHGLERDPGCSA